MKDAGRPAPHRDPRVMDVRGGRTGYVLAACPKHGQQQHLSYLNGACVACHQEGLVSQGLVQP